MADTDRRCHACEPTRMPRMCTHAHDCGSRRYHHIAAPKLLTRWCLWWARRRYGPRGSGSGACRFGRQPSASAAAAPGLLADQACSLLESPLPMVAAGPPSAGTPPACMRTHSFPTRPCAGVDMRQVYCTSFVSRLSTADHSDPSGALILEPMHFRCSECLFGLCMLFR